MTTFRIMLIQNSVLFLAVYCVMVLKKALRKNDTLDSAGQGKNCVMYMCFFSIQRIYNISIHHTKMCSPVTGANPETEYI